MTQRNVREERRWALISRYGNKTLSLHMSRSKAKAEKAEYINPWAVSLVRVTILVPTKE